MRNLTKTDKFVLVALSDDPTLRYILFTVFLLVYLKTLVMNLLIIFLLHTPMYFFLGNLAALDMSYSSVTAPRMISDLINTNPSISFPACMTQIFLIVYLASSEMVLLGAMSYDRYVAICLPLHYIIIMSWKICAQLSSISWVFGFFYSLIHTLCSLRLKFCSSKVIQNFFCDLSHLFQISCVDTFMNIVLTIFLGGTLGLVACTLTFFPYTRIFSTIAKIKTKEGKRKAFSTCTSHLAVVFIFYGSHVLIYLVPTTSSLIVLYKLISVIYTVINPLLNPLIYSVRNKEDLKDALRRVLHHISYNGVTGRL
uniref:Olfactory receptor n=1 Tax=Leptobrachium leishanense TaxID=445787 RepID=A0A8C5R5I7_9ANUR